MVLRKFITPILKNHAFIVSDETSIALTKTHDKASNRKLTTMSKAKKKYKYKITYCVFILYIIN